MIRLPAGPSRKGEGGLRLKGILKETSPHDPLVSVITAVFNGELHLEETILRILDQTYPNLEFIIVDGGSTDRTLEILAKYDDRIDYWVSERDNGIGDAFNRGVLLSRGEYLNFQGDGDGFVHRDSLLDVMNAAGEARPPLIATRIERVDRDGKHLYFTGKLAPAKYGFLFKMVYPHQGLFTNISLFEQYGLFDVKNRFCMDYEHLLRFFPVLPKALVLNQITAKWRMDGVGQGKTRDVLREYDLVKRRHRLAPGWALFIIDRWLVLKLRIKKIIYGDHV